jgi:GTP-binding protein
MLEYCERDELVEVTPESLRLRKKLLKEAERRREARHEEAKKASTSS